MPAPPRPARLPTHISRSARTTRRRKPYCRKTWSPRQRLDYYSEPDPLSGCHIWHGPSVNGGYGLIRYHGEKWLAHRLAWTLRHGPIPEGMILCHRCDERRCCNPDHLFIGSRADNMGDRRSKRLARGAALASGDATIRIIYRGVELVGEVRLLSADPRVATRSPFSSRK
jgi:hypothetical protein